MKKFKIFLAVAMVLVPIDGWSAALAAAVPTAVAPGNVQLTLPSGASYVGPSSALPSAMPLLSPPAAQTNSASTASATSAASSSASTSATDSNAMATVGDGGYTGGTGTGNCALMNGVSQQNSDTDQILNGPLKTIYVPEVQTQTKAAVAQCASKIKSAVTQVNTTVTSTDTGIGKQLCTIETSIDSNKYGITNGMWSLKSTSQAASAAYTQDFSAAQAAFGEGKSGGAGSGAASSASTTSATPLTPQSDYPDIGGSICSTTCNSAIVTAQNADAQKLAQSSSGTKTTIDQSLPKTLQEECHKVKVNVYQLVATKAQNANTMTSQYGNSSTLLKAGVAVAGVAVVAGGIAAYESHRAAGRARDQENNYNNAVIQVNGQTVDCKQSTTYTATACQPTLMNYCSQTANLSSAGCGAFTTYYCAQSGASVSYCLSGSARTYCGSAVSTIPGATTASSFNATTSSTVTLANSPSCQWLSNMPTTCSTSPGQLGCLSGMSSAQLATTCPSYTSDPLCQAYNAGEVVYSGGTTTTTGTVTNTGTTTILPGATTGTTTTASTGLTTTTATGLGGFTVTQAANKNLFAGDSQTLSALCHSGTLMGCK
jgi:hypothetical protein